MNIKFSGLKSVLHNNEAFTSYNNSFISAIERTGDIKLNYADIEDYDCDLKLIFIESGGSEGLFLQNFKKLKAPFYFLTSGDNNSLAATLEILTYLNLNGYQGEIIHGSLEYISERIKLLAKAERVRNRLNGIKLGVLGKPSDWLISSVPDYNLVKDKFGIELVDIPLTLVEDRFILPGFNNDNIIGKDKFDSNELVKATKVYRALKSIVEEYKLSGLTIRCFDLLNTLHTTGCLALAELNDNNIISTCEGDIAAMISMAIADTLSSGVFQANPSRIDVENNKIVFAHCTIPFKMLDSYKLDTHFESGTGVAVKGYLKCERVTVFRLSSDLKNYFVEEGTIIRNLEEKGLCRTQIEVKLDNGTDVLLNKPCGNHHIIFYGEHKAVINELLKKIL